jgi:hypothetical protein
MRCDPSPNVAPRQIVSLSTETVAAVSWWQFLSFLNSNDITNSCCCAATGRDGSSDIVVEPPYKRVFRKDDHIVMEIWRK